MPRVAFGSLTGRLRRTPLRRNLIGGLIGLVIVILVLESVSPFRQGQFATMAYLGIAVGGLTVLTGLNGQLSLGHGALMAVGAYTAALMLHNVEKPLPLPVIMLLSVLVTVVVGAVVGVAAARLHGPYIAGATLAMAVAVPGIASFFGDTLGGEQGLSVSTPEAPGWFADAVYFLTAHDITGTKYLAYIGWIGLIISFCSWRTCPQAEWVEPGAPCVTTRSRRSSPASTWAVPGSRRSWSAQPAPVSPAA